MNRELSNNAKIKLFLDTYLKYYPKGAREIIKSVCSWDISYNCKSSEMYQIYTYLDILGYKDNYYYGLFELLKSIYSLDKSILEVAGGLIPVFSHKYLSPYQEQIGCGTVTVMDPDLIFEVMGKARLLRMPFDSTLSISEFDLLVGIRPCKATTDIITSCGYNKKDMFLATCGCEHFPKGYQNKNDIRWENYLYQLTKESFLPSCDVNILTLDKKYHYPNPIISVKHK